MHKAPKAQDQSEIEKPLLNQALASEHDKACKDLSLKISETYKVRLNTLYDKALEKNQINYKTTLATELPAFREMIASLIIGCIPRGEKFPPILPLRISTR